MSAGLRRAKLAGDGKTRVPSHAAMGIEMLRRRIVELDDAPVEVTRGMFEGLSPRDLLCLQNGFDEMDEGVMDELQALLTNTCLIQYVRKNQCPFTPPVQVWSHFLVTNPQTQNELLSRFDLNRYQIRSLRDSEKRAAARSQ